MVTHAESDRVRRRFFVCIPKVAAGFSCPYRRSQTSSIALKLLQKSPGLGQRPGDFAFRLAQPRLSPLARRICLACDAAGLARPSPKADRHRHEDRMAKIAVDARLGWKPTPHRPQHMTTNRVARNGMRLEGAAFPDRYRDDRTGSLAAQPLCPAVRWTRKSASRGETGAARKERSSDMADFYGAPVRIRT